MQDLGPEKKDFGTSIEMQDLKMSMESASSNLSGNVRICIFSMVTSIHF